MYCKSILGERGRRVYSVGRGATIADAAAVMSERRIGAVMVLDAAGRLVGILSERDVSHAVARHRDQAPAMTVAQFMSTDIAVCTPEANLSDVMQLMKERHVRHVPVVADGRPVAMISVRDVIQKLLEETAEERDQIREYVAMAAC